MNCHIVTEAALKSKGESGFHTTPPTLIGDAIAGAAIEAASAAPAINFLISFMECSLLVFAAEWLVVCFTFHTKARTVPAFENHR
jgi:hypothetical protein